MSLWGNGDVSANAPQYRIMSQSNALGAAMFDNVTIAAFYGCNNMAVGVFGVDVNVMSHNTTHAGWVKETFYTGPVINAALNAAGSNYANGESFTISNGTSNAVITVTTNATSNVVSATIKTPGAGFTNVAMLVANGNQEQHLQSNSSVNAVTTTGSSSGYNNTDVGVITTTNASLTIVAGAFTVSTNTTGGLTNASITITNVGLFVNTVVAANLSFLMQNSTGGNSAGTSATFAGRLANGTGATFVFTLGGRANRIDRETIVAMSSIASDDTIFQG